MRTGLDRDNPTDGPVYDPATRHPYITTVSNVNIGPPGIFKPEHVKMVDIKRALAQQVRYLGHLDRWYSIAEHSVLVSQMLEYAGYNEHVVIAGLFHDAHEAYMGDIASPQKDMMGPGVRTFEYAYSAVVREALGLPNNEDKVWKLVREFDILILHRELHNLRDKLPDWYDPQMEDMVDDRVQPVGLAWEEAEALFRARMHDLGIGLGGTV